MFVYIKKEKNIYLKRFKPVQSFGYEVLEEKNIKIVSHK